MIKKCCVYTMKDVCPKCGSVAKSAHPPKFSAVDRWGKYRRMAKKGK